MKAIKDTLELLLYGKALLVGLGNRIRADDGAGSILAEKVKNKLEIDVIDAEMSVENYLEPIVRKKPDTVILIDVFVVNSTPGSILIYSDVEIPVDHFSTHGISLHFLVDYLKSSGITSIILIGIQPGTTRLGAGMSESVKEAVMKLERVLTLLFGKK